MDGSCVTVCKHLTDCEVSKSGYDVPRTHEVYIDALNECVVTCQNKVPASDRTYWLGVKCSDASNFPDKPGQGQVSARQNTSQVETRLTSPDSPVKLLNREFTTSVLTLFDNRPLAERYDSLKSKLESASNEFEKRRFEREMPAEYLEDLRIQREKVMGLFLRYCAQVEVSYNFDRQEWLFRVGPAQIGVDPKEAAHPPFADRAFKQRYILKMPEGEAEKWADKMKSILWVEVELSGHHDEPVDPENSYKPTMDPSLTRFCDGHPYSMERTCSCFTYVVRVPGRGVRRIGAYGLT